MEPQSSISVQTSFLYLLRQERDMDKEKDNNSREGAQVESVQKHVHVHALLASVTSPREKIAQQKKRVSYLNLLHLISFPVVYTNADMHVVPSTALSWLTSEESHDLDSSPKI